MDILSNIHLAYHNKKHERNNLKKISLFLSGFIAGIIFLFGCGKTEVAQSFAQSVIKAIDVVFDNQGTNLTSTNVQYALNEINAKIPNYVNPNYIKPTDLDKILIPNVSWSGYIKNFNANGAIPFSIQFVTTMLSNVTINTLQYSEFLNIPDDGIITINNSTDHNSLGALINVKLVQRNGINYLTGVSLLNDPRPSYGAALTPNPNYNLIHNYFELKQCAPGQNSC